MMEIGRSFYTFMLLMFAQRNGWSVECIDSKSYRFSKRHFGHPDRITTDKFVNMVPV